jgi:hypothetical protein
VLDNKFFLPVIPAYLIEKTKFHQITIERKQLESPAMAIVSGSGIDAEVLPSCWLMIDFPPNNAYEEFVRPLVVSPRRRTPL